MQGVPVRFSETRIVSLGGARVALSVKGHIGLPFTMMLGASNGAGRQVEVAFDWWPGAPVWRGTVDGRRLTVQVRPILNGWELTHAGTSCPARVYTEREAELAALMPEKKAADTSKALTCPMPGLVRAIHVSEGEDVQAGQQLCTVEAMKMENVLRAERNATVKAIKARPGDSLAVDAVIMEFE
jgi:propionyl-CoA carboxylase alpha chain